MNILTTQYSLQDKSLDLYLAGCKGPHCRNCHNPESWDFNQGTPWRETLPQLRQKLRDFSGLIDNVRVMGGEPLDQDPDELASFLGYLNQEGPALWLFTGKRLMGVPDFVGDYCDYIKCERYDEALLVDNNVQYGVKLASSNQIIYKKGGDY